MRKVSMKCCVPSCGAVMHYSYPGKRVGKRYTFHKFPTNPCLRNLWQERLCMKVVKVHDHVCNLHFRKEDYRVGNRRKFRQRITRLLPNALPMHVTSVVKTERCSPTPEDNFPQLPKEEQQMELNLPHPAEEMNVEPFDEISNIPEFHIKIPTKCPSRPRRISKAPAKTDADAPIPWRKPASNVCIDVKTRGTQTNIFDSFRLRMKRDEILQETKHKLRKLQGISSNQRAAIERLREEKMNLKHQLEELSDVAERMLGMSDLGKCLIARRKRPQEYSASMQKFSIGLYNINREAYDYVKRELGGFAMPPSATVKVWKKNLLEASAVNGSEEENQILGDEDAILGDGNIYVALESGNSDVDFADEESEADDFDDIETEDQMEWLDSEDDDQDDDGL